MKIGWGTRIVIFYLSFVVLIITLVAKSMSQRLDLVVPNYYEEELKFQSKLDRMNNSKELETPLSWQVNTNMISILFPVGLDKDKISGEITFFRPSDSREDRKYVIQLNEGNVQSIDVSTFKNGVFNLQIDWKYEQTSYYNEGIIIIKNQ